MTSILRSRRRSDTEEEATGRRKQIGVLQPRAKELPNAQKLQKARKRFPLELAALLTP